SLFNIHIFPSRHQRAGLSSHPIEPILLVYSNPYPTLPSHPSSNSRPTAPGRILQRSILHPPRTVTTPPPPCHSSQRSTSLGHPRPPHPIQLSRAVIHLTHTWALPPISPYLHRAINHAKKHRSSHALPPLSRISAHPPPTTQASKGCSVRRCPQMSRR
ncbi:hypothetical protein CORC01_05071, partial [Colletotrichum orchidophilum]